MNRKEEYELLMQELDAPVSGLDNVYERAQSRNTRRKHFQRQAGGLAAVFALFVLLVNFCTPAAYACSKIPLLKELAEAVTFSRSLSDAVEHQYVQPLQLEQTDNGVTATLEYLIVDQKQVNVFYRLDSDRYAHMSEDPKILSEDGSSPPPCSYSVNGWAVPNGELRSLTIDFVDSDVPSSLRMVLDVQDQEGWNEESADRAPVPEEKLLFDDPVTEEPSHIAHFDFLLKFDPEFTVSGTTIPLNKNVKLDGQEISFTAVEIYPSHLRVKIKDQPENTAWLKRLDFYIETDWGMKFDPVDNGITSTGSSDSPTMDSYRADSSYFHEARHLKLVITGAEWLDKSRERIHVNLKTGETDPLPEGVSLDRIEQKESGWLLSFLASQQKSGHFYQIMSSTYYDPEGNPYSIDSWSSTMAEEEGFFRESIPLPDYPYDEVWLCPAYTRQWTAESPITVIVQ